MGICLGALLVSKLAAVKKRGRKGKESTEVGQFQPAAGKARSERFPAPPRGSCVQDPGQGRYIPSKAAADELSRLRGVRRSDNPSPGAGSPGTARPPAAFPGRELSPSAGTRSDTRGGERRAQHSPGSPSPGQDVPARPRGQTCRGCGEPVADPGKGCVPGGLCPELGAPLTAPRPPPRAAPGASRGRSRDRERAGGCGCRPAARAPHPASPPPRGELGDAVRPRGHADTPPAAGWAETAAPQSFPGHSPAELMVLPRRGAALPLVPYATAPLRAEEKEPIVPPRRHPAGGAAGAGVAPPARHRRIPPRGRGTRSALRRRPPAPPTGHPCRVFAPPGLRPAPPPLPLPRPAPPPSAPPTWRPKAGARYAFWEL
ncbi:basic proline-rich protein-like [Molothrus aeneus]|uniref:basic proline-rich protein-like n=1 Tax=Molothrus aeneus TaxID=84833 RepID=UPI00345AAEE9